MIQFTEDYLQIIDRSSLINKPMLKKPTVSEIENWHDHTSRGRVSFHLLVRWNGMWMKWCCELRLIKGAIQK